MTYCEEEGNRAGPSAHGLKVFAVIILPVGIIFSICSLLYFLYNRSKFLRLQKRNLLHTSFLYSMSLVLFVLGTSRSIVGADKFSCKLLGLSYMISRYLSLQCGLARLFSLLGRVELNKRLLSESYSSIMQSTLDTSPHTDDVLDSFESAKRGSYYEPNLILASSKSMLTGRSTLAAVWYTCGNTVAPCLSSISCFSPSKGTPKELQFAELLASKNLSSCLCFLVGLVPVLIIFLGVQEEIAIEDDCFGCLIISKYRLMPLAAHIIGTFLGVLYFLGLFRLRNIPDSLGIKAELLVVGGMYTSLFIILVLISFLTEDLQEEGRFHIALVESAGHLLLIFLIFPLQVILAKRDRATNAKSTLVLEKILSLPDGRRALCLYLVSSLSLESLLFYDEVTEWKLAFENRSADSRRKEALRIVEKYIDPDSFLEINVSSIMKQEVVEELSNEPSVSLFDECNMHVLMLLQNDILPGFRKSVYYDIYCNR